VFIASRAATRLTSSPHPTLNNLVARASGPDSDREEVGGDVLKCPNWIYSHGELPNPPGDNRFESSEVGLGGHEPRPVRCPQLRR
jgi:hypothetical protein